MKRALSVESKDKQPCLVCISVFLCPTLREEGINSFPLLYVPCCAWPSMCFCVSRLQASRLPKSRTTRTSTGTSCATPSYTSTTCAPCSVPRSFSSHTRSCSWGTFVRCAAVRPRARTGRARRMTSVSKLIGSLQTGLTKMRKPQAFRKKPMSIRKAPCGKA